MLSQPERLILGALAVYRMAQLIAIDDGPFNVLKGFRGRFIKGTIADLVHCPYCLGIWFALVVMPSILVPTTVTDVLLVVFGLSGAQAWLQGSRDAGE